MRVGRLARVVLLVRDFEESLAFYRDKLSLPLQGEPRPGWAVFHAGEVLLCLRGPWEGMRFPPEDFGRSPDEWLFLVEDLDEARTELIARGVRVDDPHEPGPGIRVAEFRDPDGRRLALESRA